MSRDDDTSPPLDDTSSPIRDLTIVRVTGAGAREANDALAVEEPLEIRLVYEPTARPRTGGPPRLATRSLSVTMRTPGEDFELAAGFLLTEGIVRSRGDIVDIAYCGDAETGERSANIVRVTLSPQADFDPARLQRNFYMTSSCGVCGKASLEALTTRGCAPFEGALPRLDAALVHTLPDRLRAAQPTFERTGGLHAAGLFTADGTLVATREDVGRHNAVDKLVGHLFLDGRLTPGHPAPDPGILVVSGRTSFEILQKALMATIPVVVAVGAPSTLAVELAREYRMTLIGFARDGRFNVYSGAERLARASLVRG